MSNLLHDFICWLDDDRYHVWQWHMCNGKPLESMLPWPNWTVNSDKKTLSHSIRCSACGLHDWGIIGAKP